MELAGEVGWGGVPKLKPEDEVGDHWLHLLELGERVGQPERVMWAAVLVRALSDVALWHAGRRYVGDKQDSQCVPAHVSIMVYRDALQWFLRREPGRVGFVEVCDMLDLDADLVLGMVERMRTRRRPLNMREFSIRRMARGTGRMQLRYVGKKELRERRKRVAQG